MIVNRRIYFGPICDKRTLRSSQQSKAGVNCEGANSQSFEAIAKSFVLLVLGSEMSSSTAQVTQGISINMNLLMYCTSLVFIPCSEGRQMSHKGQNLRIGRNPQYSVFSVFSVFSMGFLCESRVTSQPLPCIL